MPFIIESSSGRRLEISGRDEATLINLLTTSMAHFTRLLHRTLRPWASTTRIVDVISRVLTHVRPEILNGDGPEEGDAPDFASAWARPSDIGQ